LRGARSSSNLLDHFNNKYSNNNIKLVSAIDDLVCCTTLVLFFPTFDTLYTKESLLIFFVSQIVIEYVISLVFIRQWYKDVEVCVTKANARHLNTLLLKHGIAQCKSRFGLFALILLAYVHFGKIACTGYTPSVGCKVDKDGNCIGLLYCLCACFYYTAAASQLIYVSKYSYINRIETFLFKCVCVATLSAALIYSMLTAIVDLNKTTKHDHNHDYSYYMRLA